MKHLILLLALLVLSSCSTLKCLSPSQSFFGFDGKAYSSCKAFSQYETYCKDKGGIKYGTPLEGTCNDDSKVTRKY